MYGELDLGGRRAWPFLRGVGAPVNVSVELLGAMASYRPQARVIGRDGSVRPLDAPPAPPPVADLGWPDYMRGVRWDQPARQRPAAPRPAPARPRAPLPSHPRHRCPHWGGPHAHDGP